jgi:hypothetical protein
MICDLRFAFLTVVALGGLDRAARADEATWRVWLEPNFMRPTSAQAIPGAKATTLAAGTWTDGDLKPFTKAEFETLGLTWEEFFARATARASADLATLKPRFERDVKKIITYATLSSDQPIVAAAVLAPEFLELWQDNLGEKVIVVIPNRFTAFIFPHLVSDYPAYGPMVLRAYRETAYPVSVEVFEVSESGWRCIGAYENP